MTSHLIALCFDANDPLRLARFWAGVLGWEMADDPHDGIALLPSDDTGFEIRLLSTQEKKTGQNQMHFDLTSTSLEDQQQTVATSLRLGARHRLVERVESDRRGLAVVRGPTAGPRERACLGGRL